MNTKLTEEKLKINLQFYYYLKQLVKIKLNDKQLLAILEIAGLPVINNNTLQDSLKSMHALIEKLFSKSKKKESQYGMLYDLLLTIDNTGYYNLFLFSLKLYSIKNWLLEKAKIHGRFDITKLNKMDTLSLTYDKHTLFTPYMTRVSGALLALFFFEDLHSENNWINQSESDLLHYLQELAYTIKNLGVEANQIFMLLLNESINQSIKSSSGSNYEDRLYRKLLEIGLPANSIEKKHDEADSSTEFDFFFYYKNRSYGISAKRTLRERYKQFLKTNQMSNLDVMIEVTLGSDLSKEKALTIRNYGVYLFIADEIYQENTILQNINGVYSTKDLTCELLETLK
ncbi:hypothetical protein PVA45_08640 (plasmid) [Entomospira entomophila]|uniref:Uncharacterized protein n=1 Tax=Entomospira entomophila TaxID=2719988 RepID=A0A968GC02_9SPIO|nr:hypothetical protein [Entomospira entomophilus]NIZ41575.1 hypothetical protein [Entomospira entomophilus]WDI36476.1 hypothetical protein PVA45_08640 [Entomospira entomophilus]